MSPNTVNREELGRIIHPSANTPFSLDEKNVVWLVVEGKLDIFAVSKSDADGFSARHHFLRIDRDQACFGMELLRPSVFLIASATPGTRLLRMTLDTLSDMIREQDAWACNLLDEWIKMVGARLCATSFPGSFIEAAPSKVIAIDEEPRAVTSTNGVVWIAHSRGHSYPMADNTLPRLNGAGYFPLSRSAWIQASPGSELHAISTSAIPEADARWEGLAEFHALAQHLLRSEREQAELVDGLRIRRKSATDGVLLENSLLRLTTPILKPRAGRVGESTCTDPVFLALQVVAHQMGITLIPPMEMLRGQAVVDPIAAIGRASAVRVRTVALKGDWWRQDCGPLLCFTENSHHPVALLTKNPRRLEMYDPATHVSVALDETRASTINPLAYTLYRPFPRTALNIFDLLKFGLVLCKGDVTLIAGTGLAAGALTAILPYATGIIFDRLIPGAERSQLMQMSMFLFIIVIATSLFTFVRGFSVLRLQGKMDTAIQAAVWDRLLGLSVSFFREYSSGDLAARSMGISQIREILTGSALNALLSCIFSIFSFGLLFYYSLKLALIATGLAAIACAVTLGTGFFQVRHGRKIQNLSGALSSKLLQFMGGIAKFRVSGTEGRAFASWARDFSEQKRMSVAARRISNGLIVFNSVFPLLSLGIIFYVNGLALGSGGDTSLSTGSILAFIAAFTQFLFAALTLSSTIISTAMVVPIYERARPILETVPEVTSSKANPGSLAGDIEVSHVNFSYKPEYPLILRDLTLKIRAGQSAAFVGSSGCGKSTLFRLLLAFERPASGAIYFDGQDLAGLDVQAVRRQIGVVLQSSRLVSGSIFENIVGSSPLNIDDAWHACRLAGVEEDIRRMPMGMHTMISDGGGGVSGGQRQRLMIARAIVARPRILLFDEATSALDNQTQAIVTRSLAALQATRIIIAHRLSTVENVDRIFVFDKGSIVESGTYDELMDRAGLFHELAKRQLA